MDEEKPDDVLKAVDPDKKVTNSGPNMARI